MPYVYPTNFTMRALQQQWIARNREGRIGLDIMPPLPQNAGVVRWSQEDNYGGLQALRGLDGRPTRVQRVGEKIYEYEPGVFGEYETITETELTKRAANFDILTTPIEIGDLVGAADRLLIGREFDRMESSVWALLTTGTLQIILDGPNGTQIGYNDQYTFQSYTSTYQWSVAGSATPIQDFQNVQQLGYATGISVDLGAAATAYMNQYTANQILNNSNAADFGGRRNQYGATLNNLGALDNYWKAQNLPGIVVYDGGFWNKPQTQGGVFSKFLPNGTVVVVGQRPGGVPIGNYVLTRNLVNGSGGKPGSYRRVVDRVNGVNGEMRIPPNIEIHRGHNGGPAIYYPSAVVVMNVG